MSQVGTTALWLPALSTTDGTEVRTDADGWVSLTSGTTYVFALRVSDQNVESFSVACDAAIAFSGLTIETTNAPRQSSGQTTGGTVTDWDNTTATTWVQENPPTAYIPTTGTGWTSTAATLVKTAGLGAAVIQLSEVAVRRVRLKVVVTTTGKMRVSPWGKS
jgi:hypothetical protein